MYFFTSSPTLTPVVEWVKISPTNPITSVENSDIVEFYIPGAPLEFTQLNRIMLETENQIFLAADSSALVAADWPKVTFAPNMLEAPFKNIEVSLQERAVQNGNNLYYLQAYT